jgi:hypothetical protein
LPPHFQPAAVAASSRRTRKTSASVFIRIGRS